MKIVYMGTPDFAVPALDRLASSEHEVGYVVSQPDKAKDRGKKVKYTPVKEKAMEYGIPVLQPEKIKDNEEFFRTLEEYGPDLIVVAAYGKIIPKRILDLPEYGCVNIHGSILPRWRGAAPIQRAVMEGDATTGVTLMYMAEGLDTGDMIDRVFVDTAGKTSGDLHDELAEKGAELLMERLDDFENGTADAEPQNEEKACYAAMLSKKDGLLDFGKPAEKLECEIRGLSPWPGAYTFLDGNMFKIWEACTELQSGEDFSDVEGKYRPGEVAVYDRRGMGIQTGNGILMLKSVQAPGKKRMDVSDYMRGKKIATGTMLGEKQTKEI